MMDKIVVPGCFFIKQDHLLPDKLPCWICGDRKLYYRPCLQGEDEEDIESFSKQRVHREEIGGEKISTGLLMNIDHVIPFCTGPFFRKSAIILAIVRLSSSMPSFRSSPCILPFPQSMFSFFIFRTSSLISIGVLGLPGCFEGKVQNLLLSRRSWGKKTHPRLESLF